jgi:Uncharacterized protein conserved in archaea
MRMKVSVLVSKKDPVGQTVKKLGYGFDEVEEDVTDFTYSKGDVIVVLSRHESSSKIPTLTVHHVGNPGGTPMGGEPRQLGVAHPRLLTSIFRELRKLNLGVEIEIEATHHGPTLRGVPVIFAEVGSDETIWRNETLVNRFVESVLRGIEGVNEVDCRNVVLVYGGPHYSKTAKGLALTNCISHIISKHFISELNSEVIHQSIERNITRPNTAILDSINRERREFITNLLRLNNISIEFR